MYKYVLTVQTPEGGVVAANDPAQIILSRTAPE